MLSSPVALVALVLVLASGASPADAALRGVAQADAAAYAGATFQCASGTGAVAIDRVNDDYCDCADGSDEPGTAACANGRFYCVQAGYEGKYVPSSQVNDGICDCCDGADEFDGTAKPACADRCMEEGAAWRAEREKSMADALAGAEKRQAYIQIGLEALEARKAEVEQKRAERDGLEAQKGEVRTALVAEEKVEAEQRAADAQERQGSMMVTLGIADMSADELRHLLVNHVRDTKTDFELVNALRKLKGQVPLVKPSDDGDGGDKATDKDTEKDKEGAGDGSGGAGAEKAEALDPEEQAKADAENGLVAWIDSADDDDFERPEAAALREQLDELSESVRSLDSEIRKLESTDRDDYGPEQEWFKLSKDCFKLKDHQYTYEVCPYNKAQQDHTNLGSWKGFEDDYTVMKFEGGSHCWNGPSRSMTVTLECGASEELVDVDEPSTCTYTATLKTPAACSPKLIAEYNVGADGSAQRA